MKPARKIIPIIVLILLILIIPGIYLAFKNLHPRTITDSRSGSEMILIPAGKYSVGSGKLNESPRSEVNLESFYMDKFPVTRGQFKAFLRTVHGDWKRDIRKSKHYEGLMASRLPDDLPVTGVYYREAEQYARWVGKRLPTEAEWEAAAGGKNGLPYTWGNTWEEGKLRAEMNSRRIGEEPEAVSTMAIEDMTGNIFHLTCTRCAIVPDGMENTPERQGTLHIIKAGSWAYIPAYNSNAFRYVLSENVESPFLGFRCVKPLNPQKDRNLERYGNIEKPLSSGDFESREAIRELLSFELRPGRVLQPVIMEYLDKIRPGSTVADIGCGIGYLTYILSKKTGSAGKVFAVDKDESVLDFIKAVDSREKYNNIITVRCYPDDVQLPENSCDQIWFLGKAGFVQPGSLERFVKSCLGALKKDGILVVVDENPDKSEKVRDFLNMTVKLGGSLCEDHPSLNPVKFKGLQYNDTFTMMKVFKKK